MIKNTREEKFAKENNNIIKVIMKVPYVKEQNYKRPKRKSKSIHLDAMRVPTATATATAAYLRIQGDITATRPTRVMNTHRVSFP